MGLLSNACCFSGLRKVISRMQSDVSNVKEKVNYMERRGMHGSQGYRPNECFRQITNAFEDWDPKRSKTYFSAVVHAEYYKFVNATGGSLKPKAEVWRYAI